MIKVLNVIGKRPKGGIGTFLINMNKVFNKDEFQLDYLINSSDFSHEHSFDKTMMDLESNVFILPELKIANTAEYLAALTRFYKKYNYDIIHIHTPNIAVFNYFVAKKNNMNNFILHSHNTKFADKKLNSYRNYLLMKPLKYLNFNKVACSMKASEFLFKRSKVDNGNVFIAKNAIDTEKYYYDIKKRERLRKEHDVSNNFVLGHVGNFYNQKNHSFLIDIFYEVSLVDEEAVLFLIGTGPLENVIKDKVERLKLQSKVYFLGRRDDVEDLYQVFDIFLLPSKFEGLPLVAVEAQATGLPLIVSDTITEEIKATSNVSFLNINKSPKLWMNKIIKKKQFKRRNTSREIIDSGYRSIDAGKQLEEFYKEII